MGILRRIFGALTNGRSPRKKGKANIDKLIEDLSLEPFGLELIHPQKEKAMYELKHFGRAALEPLLEALETSSEQARATIIYLISIIENNDTAIVPIAKRLQDNSSITRIEAIAALERIISEGVSDPEVVKCLKKAAKDKNSEVREKARKLLEKSGIKTKEPPWHVGTKTWEEIVDAFIQHEIAKSSPNFGELGKKIQKFSSKTKHGAWARIAGRLDGFDKMKSMRCYIEALYHDPDPDSICWGWLNGQYVEEMNIFPPDGDMTRETIDELRRKYKPIIED